MAKPLTEEEMGLAGPLLIGAKTSGKIISAQSDAGDASVGLLSASRMTGLYCHTKSHSETLPHLDSICEQQWLLPDKHEH